jgi:hypothetical protein
MKNTAGVAPQSSQETTDQILSAYTKNIPGLLNATTSGTTDQAKQELAAAQAVTPGYNQLSLDSMNQYGQQVADAQNRINTATLQGTGAETAAAAKALQDKTNPEYAGVRNAGAAQSTNLLNSINLNGLSGGERAEVERSLNKSNTATGNLGLDNATNAVQNAMQFGDRLSQKRAELGGAINTATNFMGTQAGATPNPVATAFGGPTGAQTNFTASSPTSAAGSLGFGQNALGSIAGATGAQNSIMANYNYQNSSINKLNNIGANS